MELSVNNPSNVTAFTTLALKNNLSQITHFVTKTVVYALMDIAKDLYA